MPLEQKPSGRFNKGFRKVQAAQAEARSLAIRLSAYPGCPMILPSTHMPDIS
jgi:hypothetical protein